MALPVSARDTQPLLLKNLLDRGVMLQPDNLIVTKTSKDYLKMTYREHYVKAQQLASALDRWGVRMGDRVATLMWNSATHLHCYHAVACMGAILHTLNLRLGPTDLGVIIEHANDRLILSDSDLLPLLADVDPAILAKVEKVVCNGADWVKGSYQIPKGLDPAKTVGFEDFLATGSPDFAWPDFPDTTFHALCYTSGTTGMPKGAAYSHRSTFLHSLTSAGRDSLGLSGADVLLPVVPMFHVLAWGTPFTALMLGTRLIFNGRHMDADSVLGCILDWNVTMSNGVPTVWQGVQSAVQKRGVDNVKATIKLQYLTCGGSAPPPALMTWFWDNLGVDFIQGWGMTETNPLGLMSRRVAKFSDLNKAAKDLEGNICKAGYPIPGLQFRIADPDNMDKDMPRNEPGELLARGPWIITEYFQYDTPDKFHKGWLITGDVAKIDNEGAVVITDRSKDVIKSGGEWISSIDMENHIIALAEVAMCAVVAVPHPRWDERPVVIVVLAEGVSPKGMSEKVIQHCTKLFAKFQLPDDVLIQESIPLTGTGKIDKKVIRKKLADEQYVLPSLREASKL